MDSGCLAKINNTTHLSTKLSCAANGTLQRYINTQTEWSASKIMISRDISLHNGGEQIQPPLQSGLPFNALVHLDLHDRVLCIHTHKNSPN